MKTPFRMNHVREIEKYSAFAFVVEVSAFSDCGYSEYWGTDTKEEAEKILKDESENCKTRAQVDYPEYDIDFVPAIAEIYVRPLADEDGDFGNLTDWEIS
jgi:hypothetical protein